MAPTAMVRVRDRFSVSRVIQPLAAAITKQLAANAAPTTHGLTRTTSIAKTENPASTWE